MKNIDLKTTIFDVIIFRWDSQSSKCTLHNKTLEEAMKIAVDFGYEPARMYKPSTWGNYCWAYTDYVSWRVPVKFQKRYKTPRDNPKN